MATTGTQNIRSIVTDALRKIGVIDHFEDPEIDALNLGMRALNRMLKAWQNSGFMVWPTASQTVTLTGAAVYTLSPVRPVRIHSVRRKASGIETPLMKLTRQEYDDIPQKTSVGTPTCFYFDKQREDSSLYVWPVLSAADGQTLEITYEREIEDVTDANETIDLPGEWWDAAIYGLAARLADDFGVNAQNVVMRAEQELRLVRAGDAEESVWFN